MSGISEGAAVFYPASLLESDAARRRAFRDYRRARDEDWEAGTDEAAARVGVAIRTWHAAWEAHRLALCEWLGRDCSRETAGVPL